MLLKFKKAVMKVGPVIYFDLEDYVSSNFVDLIIELKKYVPSGVISNVSKMLSLFLKNQFKSDLFDEKKGVYLGYNTSSGYLFLEDKVDSNILILKDNILVNG